MGVIPKLIYRMWPPFILCFVNYHNGLYIYKGCHFKLIYWKWPPSPANYTLVSGNFQQGLSWPNTFKRVSLPSWLIIWPPARHTPSTMARARLVSPRSGRCWNWGFSHASQGRASRMSSGARWCRHSSTSLLASGLACPQPVWLQQGHLSWDCPDMLLSCYYL